MIGKPWWVVVGLLFLTSIVLHRSSLLLMGWLLALIGGASWLWARFCLAAVSYRRRFGSMRLFFGEETDLQVEIANAKPLPLAWLRVEDEFPANLELAGGRLHSYRPGRRRLINLVSVRWYERLTRRYRIRGVRRGAWQFGPLQLFSGDIFGLSIKRQHLPDAQTILVYPKVVPLAALGLPARHPFGDFATPHRTIEDPLRLMGAREYRPGDSFRHIHWKTTARRQALQTKVFEPSASRPLAIFLNVNAHEFLYEGFDLELQEFAITAAASIARHAQEEGYQVGLYANSVAYPGGQRIRIRPGSHPDQLARIFEALAQVAEYGHWPIEAVVDVESSALPYGTTLVVVSAVVNQALRRTLIQLGRREHAPVLVALGDAHLEAPLPGVLCYHIGSREEWHELASLRLA